MAKRGAALLGIIAVIGLGIVIYQYHMRGGKETVEKLSEKGDAMLLHSDILRKITESNETISGISPEIATAELEARGGMPSEADSAPVVLEKLPLGILVMIARSPTSIAGIQPKDAYHEIVNRTIGLNIDDVDHLSRQEMLEALHNYNEKKEIEKWAKNEDGEAVKKFLDEESTKDPSAAANFVKALTDQNPELAKTFMDRYAATPQDDRLDSTNEDKGYDEVIKAREKMQQ
ncbi:MAG: hypothetical protein LBJ77_01310 [Holosporales bacterium]|jgi:hypothetical protein|nr:hypothetical protein [Holosporales bacterium]